MCDRKNVAIALLLGYTLRQKPLDTTVITFNVDDCRG